MYNNKPLDTFLELQPCSSCYLAPICGGECVLSKINKKQNGCNIREEQIFILNYFLSTFIRREL